MAGRGDSRRSEELLENDVHAAHHLGEQEVVAEFVGGALLLLVPSYRSGHTEALRRSTSAGSGTGNGRREQRGGRGCEETGRGDDGASRVAQDCSSHGPCVCHDSAMCELRGERRTCIRWQWRTRSLEGMLDLWVMLRRCFVTANQMGLLTPASLSGSWRLLPQLQSVTISHLPVQLLLPSTKHLIHTHSAPHNVPFRPR